jgi:hypothetical protein
MTRPVERLPPGRTSRERSSVDSVFDVLSFAHGLSDDLMHSSEN